MKPSGVVMPGIEILNPSAIFILIVYLVMPRMELLNQSAILFRRK